MNLEKRKAFFLGAVLVLFSLLLIGRINNDIWFLLNSGRYVWQHGIPLYEPFTVHEMLSFQMQQWLTSIIFWKLYASAGWFGLLFFIDILFAIQTFIMYRLCMLISNGNRILSFVLGLVSMYLFFVSVETTRPWVFSLLFLTISLYCLEGYVHSCSIKWLIPLPILSIALMNFHCAVWPMLFVFLLPYFAEKILFHFSKKMGDIFSIRPLLIIILLMILAGLCNPYGIDGITYTLRSYGPALTFIGEMTHPNINTNLGKVYYFLFFAFLLVCFVHKTGKMKWRYIFLSFGCMYMTLTAIRHLMFFILTATLFLSFYLKNCPLFDAEIFWSHPDAGKRMIINGLACISVIFATAVNSMYNMLETDHTKKIQGAMEYITEHFDPASTKLYVDYSNGGYTEFMGYRSYLDPRAEVFLKSINKKNDILMEYYDLMTGKRHYQEIFEQYDFTCILAEKDALLNVYLAHDPAYEQVYQDNEFSIFVEKEKAL